MPPTVEIQSLFKYYRKQTILRDINFSVPEKCIVAILGGNGSGKTTLLKIVAGLLPFERGHVRVFDASPGSALARQKTAFLPENPYFAETLSGRELLKLFSRMDGHDAANETFEAVGFKTEWLPLRLSQYSKGMLQRFNLLQFSLGKRDLLLLDEPMSGLDPLAREQMAAALMRWKNEGKTILFSSHLLADVETLCDDLVLLKEGKVLFYGSAAELLKKTETVSLFEAYRTVAAK